MILGWERRDDYWTNITSPDFDRDLKYRGYLATRRDELSNLIGVKKNCMRPLQHCASRLLRQGGTTNTGSILWECPNLSGGRGSAGPVQKVWERETREALLAGKQPLLHKAVFLLRGEEVSSHDGHGCSKGTETGLACSEDIGERVYGGAASAQSCGSATGNRHRRTISAERAYVSDRGERSGERATDLVRWGRPV